jgi:replicative DNA helicase
MKREQNIKCVMIDYLQLLSGNGKYGTREQEVSSISRALKQLAKELDIPVIALSQLNRGVEARSGENKRPQLSDLRESGAIEQDSDMVIFIHRPEYYGIDMYENGESTKGKAEIIIAKNRGGAVRTLKMQFHSKFTKFTDPNNMEENEEITVF